MVELKKGGLEISLALPGTYYKGTRFDRSGVFLRVAKDRAVYADEWFGDNPSVHDHVCGPSEEFVTVDFDGVAPGQCFVKPGVGLLRRPDTSPYDWFRLYEIVDEGHRELEFTEDKAVFRQTLEGIYDYSKTVALLSDSEFEIGHRMTWFAEKPLSGHVYNHGFFNFGTDFVGPSREITFPFRPVGDWRDTSDSVVLMEDGIHFTRRQDSPCIFMGNLRNDDGPTPCSFRISEGERSVEVNGTVPADHFVIWANSRITCAEPFLPLRLDRGGSADWTLSFRLR